MASETGIAWCDSTLNFWSGCTMVKDQNGKLDDSGCLHCYAKTLAERFPDTFGKWGNGAPRRKSESAVKNALAFNRKPWIKDDSGGAYSEAELVHAGLSGDFTLKGFHRRRIFSLSLGDWLDSEIPIDWFREMLETILNCGNVTWILCSKRPENWRERLADAICETESAATHNWISDWLDASNPPSNIILLTSVENQAMADKRIPELLNIPAACHGLSLEPLLGPVDLEPWISRPKNHRVSPPSIIEVIPTLDWLIIGGESGPQARPCDARWIRSLIEQGQSGGTAVFVKQFGSNQIHFGPTGEPDFKTRLKDKKGADPSEWPVGFRIQQWPKGF